MMRLGLIILFAAVAAGPAFAQEIEAEAGGAASVTVAPGDADVDASVQVDAELGSGEAEDADDPAAPEGEDPAAPQAEITTTPPENGEDCSDPATFEAQRDAFLEQERLDDPVYIRRIDVSVCGYEVSVALIARLNSMPAIRAGLDHMLVDSDTIVSARWTDDRGLLVYTATAE